jgi:hypothetical protein
LPTRTRWLYAGLFFVTMATLMLEVLDTRLLSVLTWYHLSFVAISVAMLGMASGAVLVFLGGPAFAPERVASILPGATAAFALTLAVSHIGNLAIPIPGVSGASPREIAALAISTLVLAMPFILSGIVVTLALTRTHAPIGVLYGADLLGAASGCLAIVWVLERTDVTSSAFAAAALAALGAFCFARYAGRTGASGAVVTAALLAAVVVNATVASPLGIIYPKDQRLWFRHDIIEYSRWNAHSNVTVNRAAPTHVFYWGAASNAPSTPATIAYAAIDGAAGTAITQWNGDPAWLDWTRYDVTSVPYQLRGGRAGIIGVGGGRDVLTAIAARSTSITGIEINAALVGALQDRYRDFARVATYPGVTLVHDEARSYLTRTGERFDVLQMSLIDTWAATGAGAFTLTENGLYTREGWQVFLRTLTPTGVLSVSRWFDPANVTETTRLVSLGVASLLDFGVDSPRANLLLITRDRVATLLVSPSPFTDEDRRRVERLRDDFGFDPAITPWHDSGAGLQRIASATSHDALRAAVRDDRFDYSAPTDRRPFFFNMLKPRAAFLPGNAGAAGDGIVSGNLVATRTLSALGLITAALVLGIILAPLAYSGRPRLPRGVFATSIAYFALIGFGFLFVQIPFLQRFSVYLGHPTYTFSIILFLMILAAGLGSFASERIDLARRGRVFAIPIAIAALALLEVAVLQPVLGATVSWPLGGRTLVVAVFVAPLAFLMGHCFPLGARLLGRHSDQAAAWMWGVNGACGVMASILAVMVSMWFSIDAGLLLAASLYLLLLVPMRVLWAAPGEGELPRPGPDLNRSPLERIEI